MLKATILGAGDQRLLAEVPAASSLVLDAGSSALPAELLAACRRAGRPVAMLLVRAASLTDAHLESFINQELLTLIRVENEPIIGDALLRARALAQPHLQVEIAPQSEAHLDVLKILSSLGVATRIPVISLETASELACEAMVDALVKPGRRAAMSPFAEILRGLNDDQFELSLLDICSNDHHVDLRGAQAAPGPEAWQAPDVVAKRIPFLCTSDSCAFCEGLCFCHGYLRGSGKGDGCRRVFAEMMPLLEAARARGRRKGAAPIPRGEARRC